MTRAAKGKDITRREAVTAAAALTGAALAGLPQAEAQRAWNAGEVVHLLPAANQDSMLLKASFRRAQRGPVNLVVNGAAHPGVPTDAERRYWAFRVRGLAPGREYQLRLLAGERALCDAWPLRTLPAPDAQVPSFRFLSYTCAGGDPAMRAPGGEESFRTMEVRHRLLARAMSFAPQGVIANGDQVYWDQTTLLQSRNEQIARTARELYDRYGMFDRNQPVLGTSNEAIIKRIGEAQIATLYGTRLRSVPTWFVADDHDYFEDDEAEERFVTFPPDQFSMQAKRAVQRLFYPEFLPDPTRSQGLAGVQEDGLGTAFGTMRIGRLLEALIYDCGGHLSLKGPVATLVPPEAEEWLMRRTRATDTAQLLHVPGTPPGWSAGKWREWYPDIVETAATRIGPDGTVINDWGASAGAGGRLSTSAPKHFWQPGWHAQHQRIMAAMTAMRGRPAAMLSGDLHATGAISLTRSGEVDMSANPVNVVLAGTLASSTATWASFARGTAPLVPSSLTAQVLDPVVERNGFAIVDVTPEKMVFRLFGWREPQTLEDIDRLQPHATLEIGR